MAVIIGQGVFGTTGDDTLSDTGTTGNVNIYGFAGNDTITISLGGNDIVDGGAGNDIITDNGSGNDILLGGLGNDTLYAGSGNDLLDGGAGVDTMFGGAGTDTFVVNSSLDVIHDSGGGTYYVEASVSYSIASDPNILNLTLTGSAVTGTGNNSGDEITGNAANNTLIGGAGNDLLDGGLGSDVMMGGAGNDTYIVAQSGDKVVENAAAGYDTVISGVTYTLPANVEALLLSDLDFNINGTGNNLDNIIAGNSKDNTLDGGMGVDTLVGGLLDPVSYDLGLALSGTPIVSALNTDGNDVYIIRNSADQIIELANSGTDTARVYVNFDLGANGANVENLTVVGTAGVTAEGNALDNIMTSNAAVDTFDGRAGNDTYVISNANDLVLEASGNGTDLVQSSVSFNLGSAAESGQEIENLTLTGSAIVGTGNALDNIINGNTASNTLIGGAGNDTLWGGKSGNDTLIGGDGNDTFIVDRTTGITIIEAAGATAGTHDLVQASVSYSLAALPNVEDITLTGTANINATGNTGTNTITGNSGNNILDDGGAGGAGDTLIGGGGNDTYIVNNTTDVVTGNGVPGDLIESSVDWDLSNVANSTGVNRLQAIGTASTTLTANGAGDTLDGSLDAAVNTMIGGAGNDTFIMGANDVVSDSAGGNNTIMTSFSANLVTLALSGQVTGVQNITLTGTAAINATGDANDNILTGNSAINTLDGGLGNDTYFVTSGDIIVELPGGGTDTVEAGFTYTLGSNLENLVLTGHSNINGFGNSGGDAGFNIITGNDHNNTLDGVANSNPALGDTLIGGGGTDTYIVHTVNDVVIDTGGVHSVLESSQISLDLTSANYTNVENATLLGTSALSLTGDVNANILTGNSGDNIINDGGAGAADTLIGGGGNDTFFVNNAGDVVSDSGTGHSLIFSSVSCTMTPTLNADLELTGTTDAAGTGSNLNNLITVTNATPGNDTLLGMGGIDTLVGGIGNDTLDGGTGADTMIGGAGNDTYFVDNINDIVVEAIGGGTADTVVTSVAYTLPHDVENMILVSTTATITSTTISNELFGTTGTSTTTTTTVTTGVLGVGNALDNTITGSNGNDTIYGMDGNDVINGGAGNDTIYGGLGNDTIDGGAGLDTLIGGAGADHFVFSDTSFASVDVVQDYNVLEGDVLDVSALVAGTYIPGTSDFHQFVQVAGNYLQVDVTGSGTHWQNVAYLQGHFTVGASGFEYFLG